MSTQHLYAKKRIWKLALRFFVAALYAISYGMVEAATLRITPGTGVYTTGATFSVSVFVDTAGKPINAAEGTITFNPNEVSVVSVSRASSIFNLWVAEPSFSNTAGTISFSGGSPAGYTGSAGNVMTVTLRATSAGAPRLNFKNGAVLANDGMGTNVLTNMAGGSYTIGARAATPEAEVIEYVAPANTPSAPVITSTTHPEQTAWYNKKEAKLSWTLPAGITGVRTLLDDRPSTVPTKVYEEPISSITLPDLPEGVSYFHVQFRNADGWGKVSHYRLAVDTERPTEFTITLPEEADMASPEQKLMVVAKDATSKVLRYIVKVNNDEPFEYRDTDAVGHIVLPKLPPGYHAFIVEAYDEAGNGIVSSFSFTIDSFEPPRFTEYPEELNEGVIPVIRGTTRPNAQVEIIVERTGVEPSTYELESDDQGNFTFIPESALSTGVYSLSARATDQYGAQSELSETVRIAVQQPGFLRVGSLLVSVLSVVISLVALIVLSVVSFWLVVGYLRRFRRRVGVESREAHQILRREFAALEELLGTHEAALVAARKGGHLTKAEAEMLASLRTALVDAARRVEKEVVDVERIAGVRDGGSRK